MNTLKCCFAFYLTFLSTVAFSQTKRPAAIAGAGAKPKLVVGIVVDQMRWDYLYRYNDRYGTTGFKRMLSEGFSCENTFIPYTPTYTAAGHTCVYTGSVPAIHGIMGNYWYNRKLKKNVYCTDDTTVTTVGSTSAAGKMSPENMMATTITDQLRLSTNFRSKVIGIALKDRGAILPAGHAANAAYWFDNTTGGWISSSYYMNDLPEWVQQLNARKLPDAYMAKNWDLLYPADTYLQSTGDDNFYENNLPGEDNTFPHITANITTNKYNSFRYTPYGNSYTFDMAKAAVEAEKLGSDQHTDFLAVSLSSTDYIGHEFGPNSMEAEDTYLRLDKEMGNFLTYLDQKVGRGQYLVFLTADHGAAHVPGFLRQHKISGGGLDDGQIATDINQVIEKEFDIENVVERVVNYQVYLNYSAVKNKTSEVKQAIIRHLLTYDAIAAAFNLDQITTAPYPAQFKSMIINGYNQKLSGDIQFVFKPHWFDGGGIKGTTHGLIYPYDSHIPLLWFGAGIKKGRLNRPTYMTDIAATLAGMLQIEMPSGCVGQVIEEVIK